MNRAGQMTCHAIIAFIFSAVFITTAMAGQTEEALTIQAAIQRAVDHNNHLKTLDQSIEAASGEKLQAGLLPDPELVIGFDEFGGSGDFAGTGVIKTSVGIEQLFLTANKPGKRRRLAKSDLEIARINAKQGRLDLQLNVARNFIHVFFQQRLTEIASQSVELAKLAASSVSRSVEAGEKPQIDETRARVELSAEEARLRKEFRLLEAAKIELTTHWNSSQPDFASVTLNTEQITTTCPFNFEKSEDSQFIYPGRALAEKQLQRERRALQLALAEASPDLTIGAKVSKFRESGDRACEVEVTLPLKIFDRNQGHIQARRAEVKKAEFARQEQEVELATKLARLKNQIESLQEELATLETGLLVLAREACDQTRKAYEEGERDLQDFIDSQKALLDALATELQLKCDLLQHLCELAFLTGNAEQLLETLK